MYDSGGNKRKCVTLEETKEMCDSEGIEQKLINKHLSVEYHLLERQWELSK